MGYNFGVGRQAPTFTISAADGSEIDLKQYRGDWYPVLVFVPMQADVAERQLAELSAAADTLWGLRGQLLAICGSSADAVAALGAHVEGLSFPLLPDDGRIAAAYGALRKDGAARAMAVIVDRAGKIVWEADGSAALAPETIVSALREIAR